MVAFLDGIIRFLSLSSIPAVPKGDPELVHETPREEGPVVRARRIAAMASVYKLGAGGRNPRAETPFTVRDGVLGSDCIGFVLWCLGIDRYDPKGFQLYGGWQNTDSIIEDARLNNARSLWMLVARPQPGDLVVFPSIRKNGKMTRMGHVGLVVEIPKDWPADFSFGNAAHRALLRQVKVIDCNASLNRKLRKRAVGECLASDMWSKPDAVFVRRR